VGVTLYDITKQSKPCTTGLDYPTIQNKQAQMQPNLKQLQRPEALAKLALAITATNIDSE